MFKPGTIVKVKFPIYLKDIHAPNVYTPTGLTRCAENEILTILYQKKSGGYVAYIVLKEEKCLRTTYDILENLDDYFIIIAEPPTNENTKNKT